MSVKQSVLTKAYIIATKPIRAWMAMQLRRKAQMPVASIFLHRVADDYPNPWSMTNATFDALLAWMEKNVDLVSIDEAQELLRTGNRGRIAVNITFDDGYADNCLHAIPTLLSKKIPFTYYVTTQNIRNGKPYPHDLKNNQPLAPNSIEEIRAMADAGVDIGVHTRTHADMGRVRRQSELELEIGGARKDITDWLGSEPNHFAFPYGLKTNLTPRAIQYVYDEGFASYCTAYGGYNFPFNGCFHMKRFHGDPVIPRVQNWLSLDPRWVYASQDYEYIPFQRSRNQKRTRKRTVT